MPHPSDVDYFINNVEMIPLNSYLRGSCIYISQCWVRVRGVPYIAVCYMCVYAGSYKLYNLSFSLPHLWGVAYCISVHTMYLYCPPYPSVAIDGTLITSYLTCLFILCIHDNIMCTISKASKVDLWLGGSEGWPILNNGQSFSSHLVRVHTHNYTCLLIMWLLCHCVQVPCPRVVD